MSETAASRPSDLARATLRSHISSVTPLDGLESQTIAEVLDWIDSGSPVYRTQKPDIPNKHLVSYFLLVDGDYVLLVDHINAQLWLPTGGHVEVDEHPRVTVQREVKEELGIEAQFLVDAPVLITSTKTVGLTKGHTDVSIWYALKGNRQTKLEFDQSEFKQIHWFHHTQIPFEQTDPELGRFLRKLKRIAPR